MNQLLSRIPTVRGELFGFSILSVILFHFCEDVQAGGATGAAPALTQGYNLLLGSVGVDIFLFLSGMGLYYSLSGCTVPQFYRRRVLRVLPTYLLLGGVGWLAIDVFLRQEGFVRFLYDFSLLSFWTEGVRTVWYIALIPALYLLFPLLFRLLQIKNERVSDALVVVLIVSVIGGCLLLWQLAPTVYDRIEIALWRVVGFILGAWFGKKNKSGGSFAVQGFTLCGLGAVFALLSVLTHFRENLLWGVFDLRFGNLFYPFIVMLAATAVIARCGGSRVLRCFGAVSLELYLSHVLLRAVMNAAGLSTTFPPFYLLCIAASIVISAAVHRLFHPKRKASS